MIDRASTRQARRLAEGRPPKAVRACRRWPLGLRRRWVRRLVATVVALLVAAAAGTGGLYAATPSASSAPQRVHAILAAHGGVSLDGAIPTRVAQAVLATEDSRFYRDPALDPQGVGRALWGLASNNSSEGGATLEVQLAKLLYTPGRSDPVAVAEQVALAFKLDQDFSKNQILGMYLDAAYYGDGAYGITTAAEHYFAVPADQLSWAQASLLAGLVQAPSAYNPTHHLTAALERRSHVLARLVATHVLTKAQAATVAAAPLAPAVPFSG